MSGFVERRSPVTLHRQAFSFQAEVLLRFLQREGVEADMAKVSAALRHQGRSMEAAFASLSREAPRRIQTNSTVAPIASATRRPSTWFDRIRKFFTRSAPSR
jgi:hypothetical protein